MLYEVITNTSLGEKYLYWGFLLCFDPVRFGLHVYSERIDSMMTSFLAKCLEIEKAAGRIYDHFQQTIPSYNFV